MCVATAETTADLFALHVLPQGRETYVIGKDGTIKCVYNNQVRTVCRFVCMRAWPDQVVRCIVPRQDFPACASAKPLLLLQFDPESHVAEALEALSA
jgi:hypothetical protein